MASRSVVTASVTKPNGLNASARDHPKLGIRMLSAGVVLAAARINAVRSFGVIVTVEPDEFSEIVSRQDSPLVVLSVGGIFSTRYMYLVSHKGLTFYTKSVNQLSLPTGTEIVAAKSIAIPG